MPHLGFGELIIVLIIVLLIFGAGKLPQIGEALGKSIKNFKRAATHADELEVGKKSEVEKITAGEPEEAEVVTPPTKSEKKR